LAIDVTFGSSLAALQYADQNNTKVILNQLSFPDRFKCAHIKSTWGLLYTKLMLNGKTIGGDTVKNTRITEDHVQVVCERNVVNQIEYNTLCVFSDKHIIGLPDPIQEVDEHEVVDILKAVSLVTPYREKIISTNDSLVEKLYVIKENDSATTRIYSVSQLTKQQLSDFDYSDTMVKFKSEHLLEKNNFQGYRNAGKHSPITLEVVKRIVRKRMDKYEETAKIKFFYGN
jgi:hypothetical protein